MMRHVTSHSARHRGLAAQTCERLLKAYRAIGMWLTGCLPQQQQHAFLNNSNMHSSTTATCIPQQQQHAFLNNSNMPSSTTATCLPQQQQHAFLNNRNMSSSTTAACLPQQQQHAFLNNSYMHSSTTGQQQRRSQVLKAFSA
jgi:hypothetical protein